MYPLTSQFIHSVRISVLKKLIRKKPDAYDGRYFQEEFHSAKTMGHNLPECDLMPDAHEIDCEKKEITVYAFVDIAPLDDVLFSKIERFREGLERSKWKLKILAVNNNGVPSDALQIHKVFYAHPQRPSEALPSKLN